MAYQKLQGHNALRVVTSDTINIPNPSTLAVSGTNTSTSANNLVDNTPGVNFVTLQIQVGSIVYNTTDGSCARVTSVAANTIGLSANIFTATSKDYSIFAENNTPAVLYIGGAGNVRVLTEGGNDVTFNGTLAGSYFPIQVLRVFATGTTATNIIAIW
jgi:hypothetical protein